MAEVVGRCGRRKQRNPRKKNDLTDEHKVSESAALATARVLTSDDEDTTTQIRKKNTLSDPETKKSLLGEIDNFGCDVTLGHHSNETRDSSCGTCPNGTRTDGLSRESGEDQSLTEKLVVTSDQGEPLVESLQECIQNGDDHSREVIPEILNKEKAAEVTGQESDQDEENLLHSEEHILEEEYVLKCIYCETTSTRSTLLRDHMRNQHPDKPVRYQCPKCEQTFLLKSHLDKHLATHSPTSQSCKICQKTFANVYRLQRHMISHSESTDLRKFKCPECGKAFKFKHHLKEHIRIHSGEKPFQCPTCSKRFSHSGSYSSHMTSKKCWVIGQSKGRRQDRQMEQSRPENTRFMFPTVAQVYSPSSGSYSQQLMKFDPASLRHQYYPSPPPAIMNPNAFNFSLYQQKLSSSQSSAATGMTMAPPSAAPVPAHQHSNIPFHLLPPAHLLEQLKKTSSMNNVSLPTPSPSPIGQGESASPPVDKKNLSLEKDGKFTAELMKRMSVPEDLKPNIDKVKEEVVSDEEKPDEKESLKNEDDISDMIVGEVKLEMNEASDGEVQTCRYCKKQFSSPVDLHQHERYMCSDNHDIQKVMAGDDSSSVYSSKVSDEEDMDDDEDEEDDEEEEEMKAERLTENQAQHLRGCFRDNKNPESQAIEEIAKIIGADKRMVQVWFENARERETKKVKKSSPVRSVNKKIRSSPSTYIPIVPNPYALLSHRKQAPHPNVGPLTPPSEDQPLDLSVRRQEPPKAHEHHKMLSNSQLSEETLEEHVLNLSTKVPKQEAASPSKAASLSVPSHFLHVPPTKSVVLMNESNYRFQHSDIYKYMTNKGLFSPLLDLTAHRKFSSGMLNSSVLSQITGVIPPNNHHPHRDSPVNSENKGISVKNESSPSSPSANQLVIDECLDKDEKPVGELKRFLETQGNLQTLANVALHEEAMAAADGKRRRKKSCKQVESEEIKLDDLEDSISNPEDGSASPRKRRRSWKGHRMSEELGLYACDQCDKQFSKQSSLARHKYEHSGARPFNCEVCSKAFKHKHHLTEHRRLHSGEKPFKCRKCGKRFSHSGSYSQHMNHRYKFCKPSDGEDDDIIPNKEL
ncbi:zinc finger E-box-binding homeobox 2-like isoform X2 [Physella acuta]|uniref:zinc finger E-box-binding homeobox 2-like isoform X2 n=1 Tax=Physella acuta TaxID=109671 RepID=UPI0027DE384D|nr:zinc finger E-box-binding homeobox 2-like isoform X2 [Physella acuta]